MTYPKSVYSRIQSWLLDRDWNYSWDESNRNFTWGVSLDNDIKNIHIILHMEKDHYIVYAFAPFKVQAECQNDTLKLINSINCSMIFGCFELNSETNEIRFRFPVDCTNATPSKAAVERSIVLPALMFMKFGNEVLGVATGKIDISEALSSIKKK